MAHILVFDSGVGGLTVYDEIRALLPHERYTYVADNGFFPYGLKSEQDLIARVSGLFLRLIADVAPDLVVVACNTASTVVLPVVRQRWTVPVVGVVPAIKPAAEMTATRRIGLLATPGAVSFPYTQKLIDSFAAHCDVVRVGSNDLVRMAEDKARGGAVDEAKLAAIVAPFFQAAERPVDVVVLGCTHFPLLADDLRKVAPRPVAWIDSGAAIARRVASLLFGRLTEPGTVLPPSEALFTADAPDVQDLAPFLQRMGFAKIRILDR